MAVIDALHCDRCNLTWSVGTRQCDGCAQSFYTNAAQSKPCPPAPRNVWDNVIQRAAHISGRSPEDLSGELERIVTAWHQGLDTKAIKYLGQMGTYSSPQWLKPFKFIDDPKHPGIQRKVP